MTQVTRIENGRHSWPQAVYAIGKGTLLSVYEHWMLALFSLLAAFAIWFVIQDVENPRVEATFPPEGELPSIEVEAVNADRFIPNNSYVVERVQVEGREDDLAALSAADFEATIDVKDIPVNVPTAVPVKVVSTRDGVKVLSVFPSTVVVTLEPIEERDFDVRLSPSGQLAAGFRIDDQRIEPLTVTLSGLAARLETVASVDLDVNLAALRDGTNVIEGELKARSVTGNIVNVNITPARGKVTYTVSQSFVQRSLAVAVSVAGQVAPGYRVGNIVIEPPVISVSGPADRLADLSEIRTEPIQLGNARGEIRLVANISNIGQQENLSLERRQVSVRIEVKPIECTEGTANNTPCDVATFSVSPIPTDVPPGLVILTPSFRVYVQVSGPLPVMETIAPGQITATVSLAGGLAGPGAFPITVTVPANLASQGVRAEQPSPINLTLGPGP